LPKRAGTDDSLKCSFCNKSQSAVVKLISSPSDYPRAYICDECIAVCHSILEDDKPDPTSEDLTRETQLIRNELHLLLEQIPASDMAKVREILQGLILRR
jgi:ATP-dependent protease Clp ATPase subunit